MLGLLPKPTPILNVVVAMVASKELSQSSIRLGWCSFI